MLATKAPFPQYFDVNGDPLDAGYVYIGVAGMDAQTHPTPIYWDAAGTIPAAQPIRTVNGYTRRAGTPALVYVAGDYSITVRTKAGALVYSASSSAEFDNDFAQQVAIDAILPTLTNKTDATKGAGAVGVNLTLNYVAGTIGAILQDSAIPVAAFLTAAERAQVKAGGTTLDLAPKINAAKAWAGNRPLRLMAGTWSVAPDVIDFRGYYGGLVGDGMASTIVKVRSTGTNIINANETSDVLVSPFLLQGLTLNGDSKVTSIIDVRYRHHYRMQDCLLTGATAQNLNAKDSWNNTHDNCRFTDAPVGTHLIGSNHRNGFRSCSFNACSTWGLKVGSAGTALDGNEAILLENCDIEFGAAGGGGILFDGSSMTLIGSYVGENYDGPAIQCQGGVVSMYGGALFYGWTATSIGVQANGGKVYVERAKLNGQTNSGFQYLAVGGGGKVMFAECQASTPLGGDQVMTGDPLDYGPAGHVFAKRLGRSMASSALNATRTELISGNAITCTCATAAGPNPNVTITNMLTGVRPEWQEGGKLYLLVVYLSNKAFNVRLSGSANGGTPTVLLGTLPATSGATKTYLKLDNTILADVYDRIEFYTDSAAVGDYLKVEECIVADSRMLDPGLGTVGNLYKC